MVLSCHKLNMILAVLERKAGISLVNQDVYVNVVGGLRPEEHQLTLLLRLQSILRIKGLPVIGKYWRLEKSD